MTLIEYFQSLGAAHVFTLNNEGTSTADDYGDGSYTKTRISGGTYSFNPTPITLGSTHSLLSTSANDTTTRTNGAVIQNVSNGGINYGASTGNNPPWSNVGCTLQMTVIALDNGVLSCIYEQGGGTNNLAVFIYGNSFSFQNADATADNEFLITLSKVAVIPGRIYDMQLVLRQASQTGEYNRVQMYLDGVDQGYATSPNATAPHSRHSGDIVLGNTNDNLKTFNNGTLGSATRSKHLSMWCQYPSILLDETHAYERFQRTVIADYTVSGTLAQQQAQLDALKDIHFADARCAIRIFQATDQTGDYRLFLNGNTFYTDSLLTRIGVQFVSPHTLTLEKCNGSDLTELSTPTEIQLDITDSNSVVTGGGSVVLVENVILKDTVEDLENIIADKLVLRVTGDYNFTNVQVNLIENVSGGEINIISDRAYTVVNSVSSTTNVIDSFVNPTGLIEPWELYPTAVDARAGTNQIASGDSDDIYRFAFTGFQSWVLFLPNSLIFETVNVFESGETEVNLSLTNIIKRQGESAVTQEQIMEVLQMSRKAAHFSEKVDEGLN